MDEAWKKARREELWNDVVLEAARKAGIATDGSRLEVASKVLELQRAEYDQALKFVDPEVLGGDFEAKTALLKARLTWQLMTLEAHSWLAESAPGDSLYPQDLLQDDVQGVARECLGAHLATGGALHEKGIDPVPVLLPRWVAQAVADGFEGLAQGETQPIFQAAASNKKGDAYTWDKMRLRAVQHVAFLVGSGSTKKSARDRVELATRIKFDTLRDLETDLRKNPWPKLQIEWAKKAGELSVVLEHNPSYANSDGNTVDGFVYALLLDLQREPLSEFGRKYRDRSFDTRQT
jgi:hypothetical protein